MANQLPLLPVGTQTTFTLKTMARILTPTMGGPTQVVRCGGDRFTVAIALQSMTYVQGSGLAAVLSAGLTQLVRLPFDQPGFDTVGDAAFASGGGLTMTATGVGAAKAGQFFTLLHNGRAYLHQLTADASGGQLHFEPMLRVIPNPGDAVVFSQPFIEGYVDGGGQQWGVGMVRNLSMSLSITEAA